MRLLRLAILFLLLITVKFLTGESTIPDHLNNGKITVPDCPQINDSNIIITASDCNSKDGSIGGITGSGGTGTYHYFWYDSEKTLLSTTADLLNVPPGDYVLQFNDGSKCATIRKTYTVGEKNAVIINDSAIAIKPSDCGQHNGSITHLNIKNAVSYQWTDNMGAIVSTTPDLLNVITGTYTLTATNSTGCSTTNSYSVTSTVSFPQITHTDTLTGSCGGTTGFFRITLNTQPTDPLYHFTLSEADGFADTSGAITYSPDGPSILKLPIYKANTKYTLTLIDANTNCNIYVATYSLPPVNLEILVTDESKVRNDACGRHTGGILNLGLSGETIPRSYTGPGPVDQRYFWTDSLGNLIGRKPDLTLVGKGTYTLLVRDTSGCTATRKFTILDSVGEATPPKLSDVTMCLPGTATLAVINADTSLKYRLHDSTQTVITENSFGVFQQTISKTTKFYVTTVNGLCESPPTLVTVTVIAAGVIIPNTFTPNNDGINDYWNIPHLDEFPGAQIDVFNRDGQLVYHSINYAYPFDGKLNGKQLPTGVYYYVIDLKQPECVGKVSGSVTLLR